MTVLASFVILFAPGDGEVAPFSGSDKVVHLLLFAALAASTRWRFGSALAGLAYVAAYAGISEIIQAVALPGRSGDPVDVLADLVGATIGWFAARILRR